MKRDWLGVLLIAIAGLPAVAPLFADGVAYRVKDLNTAVEYRTTLALYPAAALGAKALLAPAAVHYQSLAAGGLWVSDGTAAGTRLVRDLRGEGLGDAVALAGGVLFVADSPATGSELWWTDGTTAGTRLVRDVVRGPQGSDPALVGVLDGVAFLAANDGVHGRELWRSDGTAAGTWLFGDLNPGAGGSLGGSPRRGATYNGRLYFAADDGVHGPELWRTNGHPAGTYLLKSFVAGAAGGWPYRFQAAAGRLFFSADDAVHGAELWATDGSAAGTELVRDIVPGAPGAEPVPLGSVPGRLVFFADAPGGQLWVSDGTSAGTTSLLPITVESRASSATIGSRVVFVGAGTGQSDGVWATDGTAAGTHRLRSDLTWAWDIRPAAPFAVFSGVGPQQYSQLWRTDGTEAGTWPLAGSCDQTSELVAAGAAWLFACCWEVGPHGWTTCSLARTDGTAAGTGDVAFHLPRSASRPLALTPRAGDLLFGVLDSDAGDQMFRSDGSAEGTYPMTYTGSGRLSGLWRKGALLADGEIAFASWAEDLPDDGVFRTDGDLVSLVALDDEPYYSPAELTRVGDLVYFATQWLWRTDGTAAGTAHVFPLEAGGLTDVFGKLWFMVWYESEAQRALWESAGTAATTFAHPLGFAISFGEPDGLTPFDPATGSLAFRAANGVYLFDPVAGAARRLHDLQPGLPSAWGAWQRAVLAGRLFFFDGEPDGTCALWASDGTAAGTLKVKNVGIRDCSSAELVVRGDRLYLPGCDATAGCELWRSDGTAAGTGRVADLDPGMFSSMPSALAAIGGRVYFSACDGGHGCEPWVSDGTHAGTHRLGDIAPGTTSSKVADFTAAGRLVYFSADDGTGAELWAAPVEIFYDGFETGNVSRW